jgi:hypothetical protein
MAVNLTRVAFNDQLLDRVPHHFGRINGVWHFLNRDFVVIDFTQDRLGEAYREEDIEYGFNLDPYDADREAFLQAINAFEWLASRYIEQQVHLA